MATTDPGQMAPYLTAELQLIPLHRHDHIDAKGVKRGKSPSDPNWTGRDYSSFDATAHMAAGGNVGVRLSACDLVVDVDPRNFPDGETLDTDNPLRRLCAAVGLDPDAYPTVVTGSGGLHLYMTKPTDVALLDTHPDYPGVEFKSRGRQVVAAGSVHPDTCVSYVWDPLGMGLPASGAPSAPSALVELARRPTAAASTGGGQYDAAELATMLGRLDPTDFKDQEKWLQMMMACHHATDGDGRQEFIDWSTGDPAYADDAGRIGARWDSLHRAEERGGPAVTFKTLHKFLTDSGAGEAIPRAAAADDFADAEEDNAELVRLIESEKKEDRRIGEESRRAGLCVRRIGLDDAKRDLVYVSLAGGVVDMKSGRAWKSVELAATHFAGSRVMVGPDEGREGEAGAGEADTRRGRPREPKEMRVVNVWVGDRAGDRKTVDVMTWAPGRPEICPAPESRGKAVNVWQDPVYPSAPDDWAQRASKFVDHVRWLLPDGRDADDFLDWVAHIVQHPGVLPHTAWLMITKKRGVGRNWVASVLARVLAGHVALGVDLGSVLSDSFNERLSEKLLLVVDETREGAGADRYRKANRLQKVITEEHREINPKFGLKSVQYNCCRFLMFSNFMDALPIDDADRRIRVAYNPTESRDPVYYRDLYETRRDRSFVASVTRMLQERDLSAFNPGLPAPMTEAKRSVVQFLESDEKRAISELFADWPADLIGLSDVREHVSETCGTLPSNLKFLVDEAGGTVTARRYNQPGSRGNDKDYVVVARPGEWGAMRVNRERPAVMGELIAAARAEWAARSARV
jgi:hypothetical protein